MPPIYSLELVDNALSRIVAPLFNRAGRDQTWWFSEVLSASAHDSPTILTGNQIGVLFALSTESEEAIQVTAQPSLDYQRMSVAIGKCEDSGDVAATYFGCIREACNSKELDAKVAIGTRLDRLGNEVRVYLGCPEAEDYGSLSELIAEFGIWPQSLERAAQRISDLLTSYGPVIGVANRITREHQEPVLYVSIESTRLNHVVGQLSRVLDSDVAKHVELFVECNILPLEGSLACGMALALTPAHSVRYIKLEISPLSGFFANPQVDKFRSLSSYRFLSNILPRAGLDLQLQTLSCAAGRGYHKIAGYFGMEFVSPDDRRDSSVEKVARMGSPGHEYGFSSSLDNACARTLAALFAAQADNGSWSDFDLDPVGTSDQWMTAHVGACIAESVRPNGPFQPQVERAATFLRQCWKNGLSYNDRSPRDADSTAQGLTFFSLLSQQIGEDEVDALLSFQHDCGGFSTFRLGSTRQRSSWASAHSEVTAAAVRALSPWLHDAKVRQAIDRAICWVTEIVGWANITRSFWWNSNYYARLQWMRALRCSGKRLEENLSNTAGLSNFEITSYLDAAYLLEICLILGDKETASKIARSLLESQKSDGFWPTQPILRVVSDRSERPWVDSCSHQLYPDLGIYSGAAILRALMMFRQHWPS